MPKPVSSTSYWLRWGTLRWIANKAAALRRRLVVRGRKGGGALRRLAQAASAFTLAASMLLGQGVWPALAAPPLFGASTANPFDLTGIGGFSTPVFADINSDGDLDILAGRDNGEVVLIANTGHATLPDFNAPLVQVDVGLASAPALADMDGDGDLDLWVGDSTGTTLRYFRNSGTIIAPALVASASSNPFGLAGVGDQDHPAVADIDHDGDYDLFAGGSAGNVAFYRNTGTALVPAFAASSLNPFGLVDVGDYSAPALADVDGDGDLDAVVGESAGHLVYFQNTGNIVAPAFAAPSTDPFGLADAGSNLAPAFADIDSDGGLDSFGGNSLGTFVFQANTRLPKAPSFRADTLVAPYGLVSPANRATPAFVDIEGDGDLDVFSGEYAAVINFYRNTGSAAEPSFVLESSSSPFGLTAASNRNNLAFADLDGDGDSDALIGDNLGGLRYFANTGTALAPAFLVNTSPTPFGFSDVGAASSPTFADIDRDGDLDAFIGEADGNLNFLRNTGTAISPAFVGFGGIAPFSLGDVGAASMPALGDVDDDGDQDLLSGAGTGSLHFFANINSAVDPLFTTSIINPFGLADFDSSSAPAFADLDADGFLDVVVGQGTGPFDVFHGQDWIALPLVLNS